VPQSDTLYYDGTCGLCHRGVKFVLRHDHSGTAFRFAPLQGKTFLARVSCAERAALPDSMIVQTPDGELLPRSDALVHILRRLGRGWRAAGAVLGVVPRPLRDAAYDWIARTRYGIFGRTTDSCPVMSPEQRTRFDP